MYKSVKTPVRLLIVLLIGLQLIQTSDTCAQDINTIKILTIGNSFARNACEYLDELTESVDGMEIEIVRANIGGCSLEKHAHLIDSCKANPFFKPYQNQYSLKELLKLHQYDYVTIQQVSYLSFNPESFQPYADQLVEFISENAPGAKTVIHQTWAYSPDSERLRNWNLAREDMHQGLKNNYQDLAAHYNTFILPSGNAFYHSYNKYPKINLWSDDGYHANEHGQYLAGCVWFATLFEKTPKAIDYVPNTIDAKTAKKLKKVAHSVWKKQ